MANALFVLLSLVLVPSAAVYVIRQRGAGGFAGALIPGLVSCVALFVVALVPTLVFLADGPHPEYQLYYYATARWLVRIGWLGSVALIVWRCFQIGPSWAALGIGLWASLLLVTTGVATYWLVAIQV